MVGLHYIFSLKTFVAHHYGELHALAFYKNAMAIAANGAEVDEHVITAIAGNKAETLGSVEPLDCPGLAAGGGGGSIYRSAFAP